MCCKITFPLFQILSNLLSRLLEPNIHDPVIHSDILNKHGKPMFYGKIREDETAVEFEEGKGLRATDDDKIGAAGINIDNILITL